MSRLRLSSCLAVMLAGCGSAEPGPRIAISIQPLQLDGVENACWSLSVVNGATPPATVVALDPVCADTFGDGTGGITYVAPCDASPGAELHRVTLRLRALYGPGGVALTDWVDPGPLVRDARCVANADTAVTFDVTVARSARQGFFDVAVAFDDIFCSAKVDCVDPDTGSMLQLVPRPDGERGDSIVIGFACTGGPDEAEATHLYLDPPALVCADGRAAVPLDVVGHALPVVNGVSPLFGAMVFAGREALAGKVYLNVALGFAGGRDCRLVGRATATSGTFTDYTTPADTIWPWIDFDVRVTDGAALVCSQHPLDGLAPHAGVASRYTVDGPVAFQVQYPAGFCPAGTSGDAVNGCVDIDECLVGNGGCDLLTTCTNTPGSRLCGDCPAGYTGNGVDGCADIDDCAHDNGGCDPRTTCTNTVGGRACGDCPSGFSGNGADPGGCVDVDECLVENGGCDVRTTCVNVPGGRTCGDCPSGYSGNGADPGGCVDVDECLVGNGGCDARTTCTNQIGGRACGNCPPGFSGNGADAGGCVDVDECLVENGGCDVRTTCVNVPGGRTCGDCPSGYSGNGADPGGCVDVDECLVGNGGCDARTTCTNQIGGRACGNCPPGFSGNGADLGGCVDVDECQFLNGFCDSRTTCINTMGGRACGDCPAGFTGNGADPGGCVDVDECLVGNGGCDPRTTCTNQIGGRSCGNCPPGFSGNGADPGGCVDVDECEALNGLCDPLTVCVNTPGGRTCGPCPSGYAGDGDSGCSDIDECLVDHGGCDDLTTCSNTIGSRTCSDCPAGYTGNGADPGGCVDVDECRVGNGGCDALTVCINTPGGHACADCPAGYTGNGADPAGCIDVDECAGLSFASADDAALAFDRPGSQPAPFPPVAGVAAGFVVRGALDLMPVASTATQATWHVVRFEVRADADRDGHFDEPHDAWILSGETSPGGAAVLTTLADGTWSMTGAAEEHVAPSDEVEASGLIASGTFAGPHTAPSWFSVSSFARGPFTTATHGLPLALNNPANACSSAGVCSNTIGSYSCACAPGTSFDGAACSRRCAPGTIFDGAACQLCPAGRAPDATQTSCLPCGAGSIAEPGDAACRACPAGSIAPAGASACIECARGSWSDDGVTCFKDLTKNDLSWSTSGPVVGKTCLKVGSPDEATAWSNVYLCVPNGQGWQLSLVDQHAREADPGFSPLDLLTDPECFPFREPSDPNWVDQVPAAHWTSRMYACLGQSHPLFFWNFSTNVPSCDASGTNCLNCLATPNAAEPSSHTWIDDRICVDRARAPEIRVGQSLLTSGLGYCDASFPSAPECAAECAPGEAREIAPGALGQLAVCVPCPAGTAPGRNAGETWESCLPCPTGFHAAAAGSDQCEPCPAGTYSDETGAVDCRPCAVGRESQPGAASCQAAPACVGATCTCAAGFAALDGRCVDIDECLAAPCPVGSACTNAPGTFDCACPSGQRWNGSACAAVAAGDFRTYRQAEYDAATGAAATALGDHFAACFPHGVVVGDLAGVATTTRTLTLTSAAAVRAALPTTGTSVALTTSVTDPASPRPGLLVGDVVALALNVWLDACDADLSPSRVALGDLVVCQSASPCLGQTVSRVLFEAEGLLGSAAPRVLTISQAQSCAASINAAFLSGTTSSGFLCYP
ncbi:MAG: hypothetical protein U1F43_17015 [Myxococcota bacterium]